MSRPRLLFYVQHLLGIGHLRRAATLTRAIQAAGVDVTLVSGGGPIPGLNIGDAKLVQLPPTRAGDPNFNALVDEAGREVDDEWRRRRTEMLLDTWHALQPQVLMFEMFPFGRRQMRFEIVPLLQAVKAEPRRPAVISSVRDVLVAKRKPERLEEMLETVEDYFDHVVVHGDPNLIRFDETFPPARRIAEKLSYTGYVVDGETRLKGGGGGSVVVSAGSGAVGADLLRAAIEARPMTKARDEPWRILAGITMREDAFEDIRRRAGPGILVERARDDFQALLNDCRVSISQAGYNTMMDIVHAGCRAVVVPYASGEETEQTLRAHRFAEKGALQIVEEAALTPARLAAAVDAALVGAGFSAEGIDIAGARTTAALVHNWADRAG